MKGMEARKIERLGPRRVSFPKGKEDRGLRGDHLRQLHGSEKK